MSGAAPGWYPVGDGGPSRYWNGQAWTEPYEQPLQPALPVHRPAPLREAPLRRMQRLAAFIVAGLVLLVTATAMILETLDGRRGWAAACLVFVNAFVAFSAGWFAHACRSSEDRDTMRLIEVVLPIIWALLLVFVVLPVAGSAS